MSISIYTAVERKVFRVVLVVFNRSYLEIGIFKQSHFFTVHQQHNTLLGQINILTITYPDFFKWFFKGRWYFFLTHPVYILTLLYFCIKKHQRPMRQHRPRSSGCIDQIGNVLTFRAPVALCYHTLKIHYQVYLYCIVVCAICEFTRNLCYFESQERTNLTCNISWNSRLHHKIVFPIPANPHIHSDLGWRVTILKP